MTELLRPRKKWDKPMFSKRHFPSPMEYMERIGARNLFSEGNGVKYSVDIENTHLPTFNVPIIHRKDIGQLPTYDIEVKDSHSFVANGIVVHNCEHDPQKRKRKKDDILCKKHHYRFRKVKIVIEDGQIKRLHE